MTTSPEHISMKEVNRLALPAIAAGIAEPIIALIDTAFIGHIGTSALGGIGIGSSLFLLFVWVMSQTKSAISAIVSRHYGAGTLDSIRGLIPQALITVFLVGLFVWFFTDFFSIQLLELYSAKGDVLKAANSYFSIRCIGFPIVLSTFTIFGIFRGMQNTSWAMYISISAALLNVILDYALIFGIEGVIAPMGVEGAAWASLMAQVAMLIASIYMLLKHTPFKLRTFGDLHPEYRNLLGLSSGFIIRTLALNVTYFLANRYATVHGDAQLAAHTIAMNIWLFSAFFIDGYANAGNALSGRLLGRGDTKELFSVGMKLMWLSMGIAALLSLVYLLMYPWMGGFFTQDPLVISLFGSMFWIVIISQPLNAIAYSFDGIFKGLGNAQYLMKILLSATFLGFIPMLLLSDAMSWGLKGIWSAMIIFMAVRAVSLLWKFNTLYRTK
jgi:multidrug resistance protein, MATE family